MMLLDTFRFLQSPEGEVLLGLATSCEGSLLGRITSLRRQYPADAVSAAVETVELRKRAAQKFSRAREMFFTREALEQATGEVVSSYRAERYERGRVLDLGCGIGGDTIGLASRCDVVAVDQDPVRLEMARHNIGIYGLTERVKFSCADVTRMPLRADSAFLDPSRRTERGRVVRLAELSPPISFVERLISLVPNCAVKLSPAVPYSDLQGLDAEVEFISHRGECKEAVAWFGDFRTAGRRATVLPQRASLAGDLLQPFELPRSVRPPGRFIYEPDPAVIRAHLVGRLAEELSAWNIDARIAYFSADEAKATPFADAYEVTESLPFSIKSVRASLRRMGVGRVVVKKRGVAFDPQEIARQLRLEGAGEAVLILTRISAKPWAFVCRPVLPAGFQPAVAE